MKAEDYLTQEMIDKLQDNLDNNNGAIDWDDIEPLLNGFKQQLILSGVGNSTSLKEMLVDFGNVARNSKGQEVELLADAYIVYDRIKDEKEQ